MWKRAKGDLYERAWGRGRKERGSDVIALYSQNIEKQIETNGTLLEILAKLGEKYLEMK